ncbi:MAG: hypothetical protein A2X28_09920 [Elusimicrobia bacterium GWA2_56_46]|nr:MAG: hypothetical protein A2X28_09920 [Elusimicrobia bacterium GWA2_56_46]OGR56281.1 MAG: hypothetical protein A2X39_01740 [Elusimicrobia bacterium GWC2_56_31]HBB67533.1 hypothetical protein [Elusimicrobiota bacterium]HBW22471.1 hypothetical protein [Elusimicrobiota bacterium]
MKLFLLTLLSVSSVFPVHSAAAGNAAGETDDAFLEDLSRRSFRFFTENADGKTGLVADRARVDGSAAGSKRARSASIASTGFGLSALCVGTERGWISSGEAVSRAVKTLEFFAGKADNAHGWFYHWMDAGTGARMPDSEVSSIDTALLLAGVLTVKQCFSSNAEIGALADKIYRRVDFKWMLNGDREILSHGWKPETGFIPYRWEIHSEAMILYLLGIGSPSFPLPASSWRAWKRPVIEYGGFRYISGAGPLFIHQYSQAWLDFRTKRDNGVDWFDNSVQATKANRQMCLDLAFRFPDYTPEIWGITASDGASGYMAWGGPPATSDIDGTVVPSAAGGSLMFAPEIAIPALKKMKKIYGGRLYNVYGFADAFNPATGWFDADVVGIDTGIILLSAENLRSGSVWRWFMANPEIQAALKTAGVR